MYNADIIETLASTTEHYESAHRLEILIDHTAIYPRP